MTKYINEETLRKLMYEEAFEKDSEMQKWDSGCWIRYKLFENCLEAVPAADVVEQKKGKWIKMSDVDGIYWSCSECGEDIPRIAHFNPQFDLFPKMESINRTNFCPNCGAKMDGGQKNV